MDRMDLKETCYIKPFRKLKNKQKYPNSQGQDQHSSNKVKTKHIYYELCILKVIVEQKVNRINVIAIKKM